ncbi:MAG: hypothetical protein II379_07590 [Oscillospiraceae bacterium]|nr:hypothetical protein [Oscillospiraceae bacterium]
MFGYIRPAAYRLEDAENERFRRTYCGLCRTLGRRYGFAARFLLNFDFTFLSILLSDGAEPKCTACRCVVHPLKKQCVHSGSAALDQAADHSVILSWWQLQDHIADHGFFAGLTYRIASLLFRPAYRKAAARLPRFDRLVREHLRQLSAREHECCASLDAAAEPFAALLSEIAGEVEDPVRQRILRHIFYHLGRWIYLVDAADDYAKDFKAGCYNPLRYRYGLTQSELPQEVKDELAQTLDQSIRQMSAAYALCDYGVWTPVLNSIFYESFYGIGQAVLSGSYHKPIRRENFRKKHIDNEETL